MPPRGCAHEGAEIGADMVVSPDGRDLYVGTLGPSHTQYYAGGVETFRITRLGRPVVERRCELELVGHRPRALGGQVGHRAGEAGRVGGVGL